MGGTLPWALVFIGIFVAIVIEIMGIPVLPVAIGLYLPLELSSCIMIGGLIRLYIDKKKMNEGTDRKKVINRGILFCSGMIAGEGLVGILLAILTVASVAGYLDLSGYVNTGVIGGIALLVIMVLCVLKFTVWTKENEDKK